MVAPVEMDNSEGVHGSRSQPILQRSNQTEVDRVQLSKSDSALLPPHNQMDASSTWREVSVETIHRQLANLYSWLVYKLMD